MRKLGFTLPAVAVLFSWTPAQAQTIRVSGATAGAVRVAPVGGAMIAPTGAGLGTALAPTTPSLGTALPWLFSISQPAAIAPPAPNRSPVPSLPATGPRPVRSAALGPVAGAPSDKAPKRAPRSSRPSPDRGLQVADEKGFAAMLRKVKDFAAAQWELPVDELLADADVLLLGESHTSLSSVRTLTENLPRLKKAGVTHVGIEGLKIDRQESVDAYLDAKSETLPREAVAFSPARIAEYAELFARAKALGLRVIALGKPLDLWAEEVSKLAAERTGDPKESFGGGLGDQVERADRRYEPGFNEAVAETVLARRNRFMAERIAEAAQSGGKVVALMGSGHVEHPKELEYRLFWLPVGDYGNMGAELGRRLLKSFSLTLSGGVFSSPEGPGVEKALLGPVERLLAEASRLGRKGLLRTSKTTGIYPVTRPR